MADDPIKDEQMLALLYEKQKALIEELVKVRAAIPVFGGELSNRDLHDLLEMEEETITWRPLEIPETFNKDLPKIQQIAFALNKLGGSGTLQEIADEIMRLEEFEGNDEEKNTFKRRIALLTSYLYRDERLNVKKDGANRRVYVLRKS